VPKTIPVLHWNKILRQLGENYPQLPPKNQKFFRVGEEVVGSTPAELAAYIKADMARLGKVIKEAGIHE
jgi:tripartite-type tricarboxylate transporter receptor subunit TctC